MRRSLEKSKVAFWLLWWQVSECFYFVDGERKTGAHSDIRGNLFGLRGDVSGIHGDVTGIRGDVTGIRGDVSGIRGNVDDCEITDDEREKGVVIFDLIK
jgi:hypothetical protein